MTERYDAAEELRARLRAADPAASLPPADPTRVARLLEDVMSADHTPGLAPELTRESRETGTRNRSPLTWLVAAAAVLIIVGAAAFGVLRLDRDPGPPPTTAGGRTVTELSPPGAAAYHARCMVPTAEALARQTVAFDGRVTAIDDDTVTLAPVRWYAGDETDLVRIQAPPTDVHRLLAAVQFREGRRYLVSATDGTVAICGFSAPYSADLAALYERAFAG